MAGDVSLERLDDFRLGAIALENDRQRLLEVQRFVDDLLADAARQCFGAHRSDKLCKRGTLGLSLHECAWRCRGDDQDGDRCNHA